MSRSEAFQFAARALRPWMVLAEQPFAVGENALKQAVRARRFACETDEVRVAVAAVERARMGVAEYSDPVYEGYAERLARELI